MYYTYMLRCEDNTIYTGLAKELRKRMKEHFSQDEKCAKYTKSHPAQRLEAAWETMERKSAARLEYQIKQLSKPQKERLVRGEALEYFLGNKVDSSVYRRLEPEEIESVQREMEI